MEGGYTSFVFLLAAFIIFIIALFFHALNKMVTKQANKIYQINKDTLLKSIDEEKKKNWFLYRQKELKLEHDYKVKIKNFEIEINNRKSDLEKKYQSLMNALKNDHVMNLEQVKKRENEVNLQRSLLYKEIQDKTTQYDKKITNIENELKNREHELEDKIAFQNKLFEEKTIGFPWVAEMYATYKVAKYEELATFLTSKDRPAYSSAELVRKAKKAAKESERKYFIAKGLLAYYESLFPTLVEMQDASDEEISQNDETINENFDPAQNYLDKDEWAHLPKAVKFQRALDRYWDKKKSKLQIGLLYERFIGYEYEQNGWDVTYFGAIKGFEDMGRDLLIKKGNQTGIVQCKNWSAEKTIHEKHIFQLFGTTVLFSLDNKKNNRITSLPLFEDFEEKTKGIFVTSCSLSDTAKKCAKVLGIDIIENKKLERFPCIKCNIGKDGERIYHLPFDQQYDRVKIANKAGAFYCASVVEAEEAGFRRAFRWHGNS